MTMNRSTQRSLALALCAVLATPALPVQAATTPGKPQVMLAITNSQSMDGDVSGAIMTGSGTAGGLSSSSSPISYTPRNGFVPPVQAAGSSGQAPYTVASGSNLLDNSESRLNMAKQAIASLLSGYASNVDFALEDYKTSNVTAYQTWVYYMSGPGGFTFSNSPVSGAINVANPCYGYASNSSVKSACAAADRTLYAGSLGSDPYMQISASSDDADINDVLYAGGLPPVFVSYNGPSPATPFPPNFSLSDYENYRVALTYFGGTDGTGGFQTSPTNAGYVPYSPQVMYAARGFGFSTAYPSDLSATSGQIVEGMQTTGTNPTQAQVNTVMGAFSPYLAAETSSTSTPEIKAVAGQSPMAGLLSEAQSYLQGTKSSNCAGQYVILLTDGLPTESLSGKAFPPLGTLSAQKYGVSASFNADGSLNSTNDQALQDAIDQVKALASQGIKVYVVGLGAGVDAASNPVAAQTLTALAIAGGTGQFYPASSQTALQGALQTIVGSISAASSLTAPLAPISLTQGSLVYDLTTTQAPYISKVQAYPFSSGVIATNAAWDAVGLMTPSQRSVDLLSTSTSGQVIAFANLDTAAFQLAPTGCVPSTSTIVSYVTDPTYSFVDGAGATCTFEAGRDPSSPVGPFDAGNSAKYMGPPSSADLLGQAGYVAYARAESHRTPQLLFTSSDGFLYSVNAQTGQLLWGWTPRVAVPLMQNIGSMFPQAVMDGKFSVVDALDASGNWASFLVGTAMSGAYHYALELDATGKPSKLVWDSLQSSGTSPGAPAPLIVRQGSQAFAVYTVTIGSMTYLQERPLAGGTATSAELPFTLASNLSYDAQSGSLLVGDTAGGFWQLQVSGSASADVAAANLIGSTIDSAKAVFVGEGFVGQTEYAWVTGPSSITVYALGGSGWTRVWGATTSASTSSSGAQLIPAGSSIPNAPVLEGDVLAVPDYTPPSGSEVCGPGNSVLMFYDILSGGFPNGKVRYAYNGQPLTGSLQLPAGTPFTPSVTSIGQAITLLTGSSGQLYPGTALQVTTAPVSRIVQWRAL
jgi:type IV pilus assembly protein PilY1